MCFDFHWQKVDWDSQTGLEVVVNLLLREHYSMQTHGHTL